MHNLTMSEEIQISTQISSAEDDNKTPLPKVSPVAGSDLEKNESSTEKDGLNGGQSKNNTALSKTATMEKVSSNGDDSKIQNSSKESDGSTLDASSLVSKSMTYENTKNSTIYRKAKEQLQSGDFEAALESIEFGITSTLSLLPKPDELHESIAPLYYLYGTTLLYSIEESKENAENSVMAAQQQDQSAGGDEHSAEDIQIAWENLETARSILTNCKSEKLGSVEKEERDMDLAQIYARLGDLSRHNGRYQRAIDDYETCCESRRNILEGEKVWDRKIADVEYSLGMTCLLLAAEGEKNLLDEMDQEDKAKGTTATTKNTAFAAASIATQQEEDSKDKVILSPSELTTLREKSARHYVQCARILAGLIAIICGQDPSEIAAADKNLENNENKKPCAIIETKNPDVKENITVHDQASAALNKIRNRISKLNAVNTDDSERVHDLREMLDEIQETIDNAENDKEGFRDLGLMRKKAEEDAKKCDEVELQPGSTTSIGFGQDESASVGFNSSNSASKNVALAESSIKASATTSNAPPMMVVKKKKKKKRDEKLAPIEAESKRLKT